jgi:hypothetical protein
LRNLTLSEAHLGIKNLFINLRMFLKKCVLLLLIFSASLVFGQQPTADKNDVYFRAAYNYGFIAQQHNTIGHLVNGNIWGFELNYIKPTAGHKSWHKESNYPEYGVGFSFFNLDNPKQLGNLYSLFFFYDFPLSKKERDFKFHLRVAEGFAYAPVHFDPITNHKNNVISNPENVYINFKYFFGWNIGKLFRWEAGLNFSHASNGRFKVPNLGVNMVTLNSGIVFKLPCQQKTVLDKIDSSSKAVTKHELLFWAAFGANEVGQPEGKKYLAQSYSAAYYFNKKNKHKFGAGIDIYYNAANLAQLQADSSVHISSKLQNIQVGVKLAYAFNVGRLSMPVELGYHVLSKFVDGSQFFSRIGMRYYFKNNVVAVISLKTQWAVANYIEFGAGYRLPLKTKIKT